MSRLVWFGLGVGTTLWTERRLRQRVGGDMTPANVGREAARMAASAGVGAARAVGEAVVEATRATAEDDRPAPGAAESMLVSEPPSVPPTVGDPGPRRRRARPLQRVPRRVPGWPRDRRVPGWPRDR